jgi:hypothetical protein
MKRSRQAISASRRPDTVCAQNGVIGNYDQFRQPVVIAEKPTFEEGVMRRVVGTSLRVLAPQVGNNRQGFGF